MKIYELSGAAIQHDVQQYAYGRFRLIKLERALGHELAELVCPF